MVVVVAERVLPVEFEAQAARIVAALQQQAERHCHAGAAPRITLGSLRFTCVTDPASGLPGYEGVWRNAGNHRCGSLTFNGDGSFYAEYDIFMPHPRDARWSVEMVTAWGDAGSLRSEASLIPAL